MSAIVFCGPTLTEAETRFYPDLTLLPPVGRGDLYAATLARPRAIAIVDGYFDGQPAVLHKEVLWALSQGIAVFGAASMGALRAAELHSFGMRGVGRIFENYRDGILTDDDEVALIHGPAETGYVHLSEPMVNIRATVSLARREGILDPAAAESLVGVAKSLFYQDRSWRKVLAAAGTVDASFERFAAWLPDGRRDQKREDALAMLKAVRAFLAQAEAPEPTSFTFEWTESWEAAPWRKPQNIPVPAAAPEEAGILDELRLEGGYAAARLEALLHILAEEDSARHGNELDGQDVANAMGAFRTTRRLLCRADLERWAAENDLNAPQFERMIISRARLEALAREREADLRPFILDHLRESGRYGAFRDRARAKAAACSAGKMDALPPATVRMLSAWFSRTRLGRSEPPDLEAFAATLGLSGLDQLHELLRREYATAVEE